MYFETRAGEYFVLYAIIFHHFSIMKPCHSCTHCWKKSDLVRQAVAAICYHYCDSLKNIYGCSFNLWFVNVLHFQSWKKKSANYTFQLLKMQKRTPRLCERASGLHQRAAAYSRCCCRSPHETAQHITRLLRSLHRLPVCQGSFQNSTFFFSHIALNSLGLKYMAALLLRTLQTSQVVRGKFALCPIKFGQPLRGWRSCILWERFKNYLKNSFESRWTHL